MGMFFEAHQDRKTLEAPHGKGSVLLRISLWLNRADESPSSGMCKAGFAGDDAPRAVFRKCTALEMSRLAFLDTPVS